MLGRFAVLILAAVNLTTNAMALHVFQNNSSAPNDRKQAEVRAAIEAGTTKLEQGKYDEARRSFEKAIKLDPGQHEAYYGLAAAHYFQFSYKSASEALAKAIEIAPRWLAPYLLKAEVDIGLGQPGHAEEAMMKAAQMYPRSPHVQYWLGCACWALRKYELAADALNKAIQLKPDYFEAHCKLGEVYGLLKRDEDAIASYNKAIALNPSNSESFFHLCLLYIKLKDFTAAREKLNTLKKLNSPNADIIKLYVERAEKLDRAEKAVRAKPDDPSAHLELGIATMEGDSWVWDGRHERAKKFFQEALRIKPDYAEAHFWLGFCYVELEDKESARRECETLKGMNNQLATKLERKIKEGTSLKGIKVKLPDK